ncbi:MAG: DUF4918 family protein [Bacteroidales bacterium]|nr:DUF4918 family protein [Bacteroidales bacterium]
MVITLIFSSFRRIEDFGDLAEGLLCCVGADLNCFICIGGGKNFKYLNHLNDSLKLFRKIIPLDHPRFIMQYRRKALDQYVKKYLEALNLCETLNNP